MLKEQGPNSTNSDIPHQTFCIVKLISQQQQSFVIVSSPKLQVKINIFVLQLCWYAAVQTVVVEILPVLRYLSRDIWLFEFSASSTIQRG